jgi:hypothetical protein
VIKNHQITPANLYNFDETGFALGQGKPQKVATQLRGRRHHAGGESKGENVTLIECVNAEGFAILRVFVWKYHMERWFTDAKIPQSWRLGYSDSGYVDDELYFQWLQHFNKWTKDRATRGQKRLLLMDNYASHLTYEFVAQNMGHNTARPKMHHGRYS